jgi:hypothetical protein
MTPPSETAIASTGPAPRKTSARCSPQLKPFKEIIGGRLRANLDTPRKKRYTPRRFCARLIDGHDTARVPYSAVRDYVEVRQANAARPANETVRKMYCSVSLTQDRG